MAAQVLAAVLGQRVTLDLALERATVRCRHAPDRALVAELCYGVLRWLPRLDAVAKALLKHPLPPRHLEVRCLLLIGLYQLVELRIPDHAAVAETVAAARAGRRPWAASLINAILRAYLRERPRLDSIAAKEPEALAHPEWLLQALAHAWPADWRQLVAANNTRPPMWLRVNRRLRTVPEYLQALAARGSEAIPCRHAPDALKLQQPVAVERLPGFRDGWVSVQDAGAQLAAPLLPTIANGRILDACAAPGGKTTHLLEHLSEGVELLAIDKDPARCQRVEQNLQRLGLAARVLSADATSPGEWWDGRPFQGILLDAPCSASGVVRRHPDIKWRRRPEDLIELTGLQARLLAALWPLLAPGGRLVYVTCSVLPAENQHQIERFLSQHPSARVEPIRARWGRPDPVGRQILPGEDGMDGFYYSCLARP